jgi:hypothetical protein
LPFLLPILAASICLWMESRYKVLSLRDITIPNKLSVAETNE